MPTGKISRAVASSPLTHDDQRGTRKRRRGERLRLRILPAPLVSVAETVDRESARRAVVHLRPDVEGGQLGDYLGVRVHRSLSSQNGGSASSNSSAAPPPVASGCTAADAAGRQRG